MLKADRDQIMEQMQATERNQFWQFVDDYRSKRKAADGAQMPAREMLDAGSGDLSSNLRQAMEAMVARDDMGPNVGEIPPDFNLKRMGSDERVQLSSFKDERPVALIFGSYT
jgi:hypothetical protein